MSQAFNGLEEFTMHTTGAVTPPLVALEYAEEVRRRLGQHVKQIVLFGSHARGEGTAASDYDFVIIVDSCTRFLRNEVVEAGTSLLNRREALCVALIYDSDQWSRMKQTPLGWNVERDGVLL